MKRRDLIKTAGLAGVLSTLGLPAFSWQTASENRKKLRLIHMTDVHLYSEKDAPNRLRRAFQHMHKHFSDAEFIINGGDVIMDALKKDKLETQKQWDLWHHIVEEENRFEIFNCIGNHDVWGGGSVKDEMYGKKWAVEALEMPGRFYSFDKGNWRFIVLDSTRINSYGEWYTAKLDQEQFTWLSGLLDETPVDKQVLIVTHIPVITATSYFVGDSDRDKAGYWHFPHSWMHGDARRISQLLEQHQNVKGVISGHMHQVDRVSYKNVDYFCNGAISGAWWNGPNEGFAEGYAVMDLFDDGSISTQYVAY